MGRIRYHYTCPTAQCMRVAFGALVSATRQMIGTLIAIVISGDILIRISSARSDSQRADGIDGAEYRQLMQTCFKIFTVSHRMLESHFIRQKSILRPAEELCTESLVWSDDTCHGSGW